MNLIEAIEISIVKWKFMEKQENTSTKQMYHLLIEAHPEMVKLVANCGLCEYYGNECHDCVLAESDTSCKNGESLYQAWEAQPGSKTAKAMRVKLEKILENELKEKMERKHP